MVPAFTAVTEIELPVPCTYDLEVASARYLQGLDDGTIPLLMLFSGTVFVATEQGYSVELVPWSAEASYRMPVSVWRELVDAHFPGSAWLRCSLATLDALAGFKRRHALPTWDATLAELLAAAGDDERRGARPQRRDGGDAAVNLDSVRKIADAVLYEGYILYPYRASAQKNRSRWQFGVIMAPGYAAADPSETSCTRAECLMAHAGQPVVRVILRFLQVQRRTRDGEGPVAETWDEAVEREVEVGADRAALSGDGVTGEFTIEGGEDREEGTSAAGSRWPGW